MALLSLHWLLHVHKMFSPRYLDLTEGLSDITRWQPQYSPKREQVSVRPADTQELQRPARGDPRNQSASVLEVPLLSVHASKQRLCRPYTNRN